ncbi:MAG: glycoside hydrolase family 97 N-terminal domain-containing protein, partial [Clostridiales bacterium]
MNSFIKSTILLTFLIMSILSCNASQVIHSITSPDGKVSVTFKDNKGELFYSVSKNNKPIPKDSRLGFILNKNEKFYSNFSITGVDSSVYDEKWEQPWGES